MRRTMLTAAFMILAATRLHAQVGEKPIRWTWIVTSCGTWNCAAAALVLADGDKHTIILPTGNEERPWLILRRVEDGSVYIPEDEPYGCELYTNVAEAGARFTAMKECHGPLILNVPDGRAVVISLHDCPDQSKKRRAVH